MPPRVLLPLMIVGVSLWAAGSMIEPAHPQGTAPKPQPADTTALGLVTHFGATGDGQTDDTVAIQRAVDAAVGSIRFPRGVYRVTRPIVIDLDKAGFTSLHGDGVATIVMAGEGPAFRLLGSHNGTAAPASFEERVWERQRSPLVDGLEIVGAHPQACGIEADGTMQLTVSRVTVRRARHGVHLVRRNRNVVLSECHLYHNTGIGVFLDHLNLHQINIANCHISYNAGGGVVATNSEIRNLQIGTCDIEGNMGGPNSQPTANILLDSTDSSIGEVAIVGCTIQHSHDAPDSANIRINSRSVSRSFTDELRHGNITIADNVMSDVRVNIEVRNSRSVTITGNTIWKGYDRNVVVDGCQNVVFSNNVCDRNPRYHYGDGSDSRHGVLFSDCTHCTLSGNQLYGLGQLPAALEIRSCSDMNIVGCSIFNYGQCGLLLEDLKNSRVSDCLIRQTSDQQPGVSLRLISGSGNQIVDNLLGEPAEIAAGTAVVDDNLQP